ncbi:MAG: exonuclease SbcCD subunit D [Ruminococcus sp.]|nr:exonuclease SbcCD subunit D [Ruminococcus sp.]
MRFAHISDLHLGKKLRRFSLIDDQRFILDRIADAVEENRCEGVLIAGDVYDKSAPSAEAMSLLDSFLTRLGAAGVQVFMISGNHDNVRRVSYGSKLMELSGIYIASEFDGTVNKVTCTDRFGDIDIYMLPFIQPSSVRRFFPESQIEDFTSMMRAVTESIILDESRRNVLICHQFITGAVNCGSDTEPVGTLECIDADVFDRFDYVALGHIHSAYSIRKNIRYCGTPLKYSETESGQEKTMTIVDLGKKGELTVSTVPLVPMRDLHCIKGDFRTLVSSDFLSRQNTEDYFSITLTDDEKIPEVFHRLENVYPYMIRLDFDNNRTRSLKQVRAVTDTEKKSPMELFTLLYEQQNNIKLTQEQRRYLDRVMQEIWGEEE